ncbi:carbamoyltransferase [Maridesulfovibrio sp.]|uniref:carbamoyltransferase family protein n=1 Tax=Maridesulfovibrio sp. TaxID=2795000 RepID=UPI003AFFE7F7
MAYYILGLNDSNSAAALMRDGELVAAARQERFDRIKFSDKFPLDAVSYCLQEADIDIKQVDQVVFAWNPGHELEPQFSPRAQREHRDFLHYVPNQLLRHVSGEPGNKRIKQIQQRLVLPDADLSITFAPHHECHACAAFFASPFESAAIMTMDAYGDDHTHAFWRGAGNRIERLGATKFPHSIGAVYAAVTQFLGYRANSDEWKVMGLAAYGKPTYYEAFAKMLDFDNETGQIRVDLNMFSYYLWSPRRYTEAFTRFLGPERLAGEELTQRHKDIAASFQKRVEEVGLKAAARIHEMTGEHNLCLAGGVFMNSKMNGLLQRDSNFDNVWVQPSADDGGGALGACLWHWCQELGNPRSFSMDHDYWGPGYSEEEIKEALDASLIEYERLENPAVTAAQSIAKGRVVGWFQGRMEYGQRALGNRSILADPRQPEMKDKINAMVKHREWYRPFAPAVLAEYQSEYFQSGKCSPFMQMVYDVRMENNPLGATTHADNTARIQTVTRAENPLYWELIDEFRKLTGVASVLNTSFNDNDEPIVMTPVQAIRTFYATGIEELFIGPFRLVKPKSSCK